MTAINNTPSFSSYSVADPQSDQRWRVTHQPVAPAEAGSDTAADANVAPKIERQVVQISQAGLDRYQAEVARAGEAARQQALPSGTAMQGPHLLSDEDHQALMASLAAPSGDPLAAAMKSLEGKWQAIDIATDNLRAAYGPMEQAYQDVMTQLGKDHPDLQGATFGFSVDATGRIVLTQTDGLDQAQAARVEKILNDSDWLVAQANQLADAQIAVYHAESFHEGFVFDRSNYAQTIDIGESIRNRLIARDAPRDGSSDAHMNNWNSNWRNQLFAKGERV